MDISTHARELQKNSVIYRGHADVYEIVQRAIISGEKNPIYDAWYPRLKKGGVDAVVLAVSGDSPPHRNGDMRYLHGAMRILDQVVGEIEENPQIEIIRTPGDVPTKPDGKLHFLLTLEGGLPLECQLSHLRNFYRLGIRLLQPTHNVRNDLADGGAEEHTGGKLSRFGMQVIEECNRLGIIVDLAHISEAGFWHVLELAKKPVIVSHGNAKKICGHKRNLTDEQLKAIAEQKGLVGMLFLPNYINEGPPTVEGLLRMAEYMLEKLGPECLAIGHLGLDKDIVDCFQRVTCGAYAGYRKVLNQYNDGGVVDEYMYGALIEGLVKMGVSDDDIAAILGGNWARVIKANL